MIFKFKPISSTFVRIRDHDEANQKNTCQVKDLAVPVDQRVNPKESETGDKYLNLARMENIVERSDNDINSKQSSEESADVMRRLVLQYKTSVTTEL